MLNSYLNSIQKQFEFYKSLGEKTFEQLSEEQLFWQSDAEANSIAIIVKHMVGNMLSRWTNFLTEDGEKMWRKRDQEFVDTYKSKKEMPCTTKSLYTRISFNFLVRGVSKDTRNSQVLEITRYYSSDVNF